MLMAFWIWLAGWFAKPAKPVSCLLCEGRRDIAKLESGGIPPESAGRVE